MQDQSSSPVRVAFGALSVLVIVYGLYSLGAGLWLLIAAAKTPAPPAPADMNAKAFQDAGAAIGTNYVMFAAEFGAVRGLVCCLIGLGGLLALSAVDTMEQTKHVLGHIWREMAAKNQP